MCIVDKNGLSKISFLAENFDDMAIMITDINGKIEYVNSHFTNIFKFQKEELINQTPRILKSNKHDEQFYKNLWQTILSGKKFKSRVVNKTKNGDTLHLEISIYPIKENDEVIGFITFYYDITYFSHIENKYKLLLNSLRDVSIIILDNNSIVYDAYPEYSEELYYQIIEDEINFNNHLNLLNLVDNDPSKTYHCEFTIDYLENEAKVYLAYYSRFNLNKYMITLVEITNSKIEKLKRIYEENIDKLKKLFEEYDERRNRYF